MQKAVETAIFKVTHSSMQFRASNWNATQVQVPKHTKPKLPKPIVRSYLTLNIAHELIKPKLLFLIRFTPKLYHKVVPQVLLAQC